MRFLLLTLLLILASCSAENRQTASNSNHKESAPMAAAPAPPKTAAWPNRALEKKTDGVLSQLIHQANLVFKIPESANIDERIHAQLLIDLNSSIEELKAKNTAKGLIITDSFKTTQIVSAKLIAPDFEVTNVESTEQVLVQNQTAEWNWTLKPKSVGTYEVRLTVDAKVEINGREKSAHVQTFDRVVTINVTTQQIITNFIFENWQWLWSTLLVPFALWFYTKVKNKPKK